MGCPRGSLVLASCGAGSVGGMMFKPLPYGWYSKRASKRPLKEMRAASRKKVSSQKNVDTAQMHERWMLRYYDRVGEWPSKIHAHGVRGMEHTLYSQIKEKYNNWVTEIDGLEELAGKYGLA